MSKKSLTTKCPKCGKKTLVVMRDGATVFGGCKSCGAMVVGGECF